MTLYYLDEKCSKVIEYLEGEGSLQNRLVLAYRDSLHRGIHDAELEGYLPDDLMAKLSDLKLRLESWDDEVPMPTQGALWCNIESLSNEDAEDLAVEILGLCQEVTELYEGSQPPGA